MIHIDLGPVALTGDRYNWICQRWVALGDDARDRKDMVVRNGVRGRWVDAAFYGQLGDAAQWLHDALVKASEPTSLDALVCAVADAAGAIAAAVAGVESRRAA